MKSQGMRVVLTPDEGRRLFIEQLPRAGVVEREVLSTDGNRWSLLVLDRAFDYQVQDQHTKAFSGFEVKRLLIRSRWGGYSVGGTTPTSVFVLIAGDDNLFDEEKIDPKKFYFDAWAMCQNEKTG
jgi:hypothetical protein